MAKGIVIVGYEGKDIPQEYRDRVAKRELRCLGIAMVKDGQIIVERRNGSIDAEGIKQIQDAIKEEKVFHLGEYPVSFNLSDMQPFVLATNKDEEPILVAFLEGDFSNSLKKNSSHLDVWHAAVEGIQPTVEQLHRLCKGNIDDIVKELKDEAVASKIESLITSTGSVTFLAVNGDIWSHSRGKQLHEFDWGAVSETLGLDKKKDEPKDSKSMLGSLLGKVSGLGVPITPNHKAQPDQAKPPKVVTATVDVPVVNGLKQYPEEKDGGPKRTDMSHLKTVEVKAAYKAYRRLLNMKELPGHIVAGIKAQQFPAIVSSQDGKWWEEQQKAKRAMGTEAIVAAVKSLPAAVAGTKPSTAPEKEYTIEELMEQEEAEAAAAAKASETATVEAATVGSTVREAVPILTAEEKKDVIDHFLPRLYDVDGNRLAFDPRHTIEMEKNNEKFTKAFALGGVTATFNWYYDDLLELAKEHPSSAANLLLQIIQYAIEQTKKAQPSVAVSAEETRMARRM